MKETLLLASHEHQNVSEAVVEAVADAKGVSTMDLRPPLYEAVDPDALDELVGSMARAPDASPGNITFAYCGYEVGVSADGEVSVSEAGEQDATVSDDWA